MINIKFTQQNVLYHVFDINLFSTIMNNNISNAVLILKRPLIIYSLYKQVKKSQKSSANSSMYFSTLNYSDSTVTTPGQDKINDMVVSESLLHHRSKNKQRKRQRSTISLQYNSYAVEDSNSTNKTLVRSLNLSQKQIASNRTTLLAKSTNAANTLESQTELSHKVPQNLTINGPLTVNELSKLIALPASEIIKFLFLKGISVTINQTIGIDIATSIATDYGFTVINDSQEIDTSLDSLNNTETINGQPRFPIIAIVGDINHGKTSLLRAIQKDRKPYRKTSGITQTIEVHEASIDFDNESKTMIFLDTPGHEAFIGMKFLSIKITDLVILVIAADEGITSQAIEAIKYIRMKQIPKLIVISKIDLVTVDVDKVKYDMIHHHAFPQEWENSVSIIPVSTVTGENMDVLLSNIMALVERQNLKANLYQKATGVILNAHLDKNKGPIANVVVQNGTLNVGDCIVAGVTTGKVRVIKNSKDLKLRLAGPSSFVEVWGFSKVPIIGCTFTVTTNDKEAKKIAKQTLKKEDKLSLRRQLSMESATNVLGNFRQINDVLQVKLIIKADTQGSVDAIISSVLNILQLRKYLKILSISVGMITETDIKLAILTKSMMIGFNTDITSGAQRMAKNNKIDTRQYTVIYDLLHDLKNHIRISLEMKSTENCMGTAKVCSIFPLATGKIAGCIVDSGKIALKSLVEVWRNESVIHKGSLKSLKHMKDNVLEAEEGEECGISVSDFDSWEVNDKIKCYSV